MGALLISLSLFLHQGESIVVKHYGKKYGKGGMFFNAIICFCALIYFIVTELFTKTDSFYFPAKLCMFGLISGIFYAIGFYAAYAALRLGSYGMTRLLSSFGTIIPIAYGILFLKESSTVFTYISVAMILFSLFLMNYQKPSDQDATKISFKWVLCVTCSVLANAGIAIVAKTQQMEYGTVCNNEFLILSYLIATASLIFFGFLYERKELQGVLKTGLLYGSLAGILSGINNLCGILTYLYVPISVVSPVKTALSLVLSFLISVLLYKEKFTKRQLLSVVIGIVAVILINL